MTAAEIRAAAFLVSAIDDMADDNPDLESVDVLAVLLAVTARYSIVVGQDRDGHAHAARLAHDVALMAQREPPGTLKQ